MQILAIEKDVGVIDSQVHAELLRQEAAQVWQLKGSGTIREIWFTCRDRRAVVMLECASEDEAWRHLQTLPLVRAGLITFEVMALGRYDGFDRLMR